MIHFSGRNIFSAFFFYILIIPHDCNTCHTVLWNLMLFLKLRQSVIKTLDLLWHFVWWGVYLNVTYYNIFHLTWRMPHLCNNICENWCTMNSMMSFFLVNVKWHFAVFQSCHELRMLAVVINCVDKFTVRNIHRGVPHQNLASCYNLSMKCYVHLLTCIARNRTICYCLLTTLVYVKCHLRVLL